MNVLVCNNFVRGAGGIDATTMTEVRGLREQGHRVLLFGIDNSVFDRSSGLAKAQLLASCLYSLPARESLRRILSNQHYDVAHVHNTVPLLTGSIYDALRKHQVITIQHLHNFRAFCLTAYAYRNGEFCDLCVRTGFTACARHRCYHDSFIASATLSAARLIDYARGRANGYDAHAYIANSAFTREQHVRHGLAADRIWVVHNPSEDVAALIGASTPKTRVRRKQVTFVGSLLRAKGVYAVLDVAQAMPDWEFQLVGAGPEYTCIEQEIAVRRLRNVRLRGQLVGATKAMAWQNSFLTLAPSMCDETFGLVIPESYSLGIPVVSTGSGGMAELVREGTTGFIQRFRNPAETATLIRGLWQDNDHYAAMSVAARLVFEAEFSERVFTDRLALVQAEILERHGTWKR